MNKIGLLRTIVDNGWTILNRKMLKNSITPEISNQLTNLSFKTNLGMDVIPFSTVENYLQKHSPKDLLNILKMRLGIIKPPTAQASTSTTQRGLNVFNASITSGDSTLADLPDDYVSKSIERIFVKGKPEHFSKFPPKRLIPATKDHYEEFIFTTIKPRYHINMIISNEAGYGTRQVGYLVEQSLHNPTTKGRVTLEAAKIENERICPSGFYYKLGLRFTIPEKNMIYEQWIKSGGKQENAPIEYGLMYLPKKNILDCLFYRFNKMIQLFKISD